MVGNRSAIVLCGGKSRRMGASKALVEVGGIPLLTRVCAAVSEVVSEMVVVSAKGQELPPLPENAALVEDTSDYPGPLLGIVSGFEALTEQDGHTFLVGCDYPFLSTSFLNDLLGRAGESDVVGIASDRPQPLCCWYRTEVLLKASDLVASGEARLSSLLEDLNLLSVAASEIAGAHRAVISINTPEEHAQAEESLLGLNCDR